MINYLQILLLLCVSSVFVSGHLEWDSWDQPNALDVDMLNDLDPELCNEQLAYIGGNTLLRSRFLDAGIRIPRGILTGNLVDLGNYYQCIRIEDDAGTSTVQGKYCSISVPLTQNDFEWPSLPDFPSWPDFPWPNSTDDLETQIRDYQSFKTNIQTLTGSRDDTRISADSVFAAASFTLALCIPKPCTSRVALDSLFQNLTTNLNFEENYCRLANDKPFVAADYVAFVIFGLLGVITLLSTAYDVRHSVLLKRDPKSANTLYKSFSVYSNARSLCTYTSTPKTIECLDGLRVLAMMWVIIGHTYSTNTNNYIANPLDTVDWQASLHSVLITAAPISVDTFFMLSGILIVYTTVGKMKSMTLIKNVHLFYLNRLLRMFPILATGVLLTASWFNHVADGPFWQPVIRKVHNCRTFWWSTLLHVQNYMNPADMCLGHTWYLAVDIQLHILSPIILFWVYYSKRAAWVSLTSALIVSLTSATIYNAINNFKGSALGPDKTPELGLRYMRLYYINTLTRASPFFVGMIYGYILHVNRLKKTYIKRHMLSILWALWAGVIAAVMYIAYPMQQPDWDNDAVNLLVSSFMRPVWAMALGWMIFACANGYGGPINWFLSLQVWKIPSRLSYGMYILHYPLIIIMNHTSVVPMYFSDRALIFRFFADISMAFFVSFLATLIIDTPCSMLIKMMLGGGGKGGRTENQKSAVDINHNTTIGNGVDQYHEGKTKL